MSTTDEQRRSVGCLVCGRVLGSEPRPVSEPAAPVDARDALIGEINNLAYHGTMYLSERESGNVRLCFADIISKIESHRDSIARQAAAPAEGETT